VGQLPVAEDAWQAQAGVIRRAVAAHGQGPFLTWFEI
jgi:hypothetical protein